MTIRSKASFKRPFFILRALLVCGVAANSEVLPFFNPVQFGGKTKEGVAKIQFFIADDPVSLQAFFDDWSGDYHPRKKDNAAAELARIDAGIGNLHGFYVGYFYQRDVLIRAGRGFVDGYYTLRNDLETNADVTYDLRLGIEGIDRHGIVVSREMTAIDNGEHRLRIGVSGYLSYDNDVQYGHLEGVGVLHPNGTYSARAVANYHFSENYLYDGWNYEEGRSGARSYGIGYGMHIGIHYENTNLGFEFTLLANDLFARSEWERLPYSKNITINTENQTIGDDGYVQYDPTVSGYEIYEDYVFKPPEKYHVDLRTKIYGLHIEAGYEKEDFIEVPYVAAEKRFDNFTLRASYDFRFETFGLRYADENYYVAIRVDALTTDYSAVGLSCAYRRRF
jgi:hypothetical protein